MHTPTTNLFLRVYSRYSTFRSVRLRCKVPAGTRKCRRRKWTRHFECRWTFASNNSTLAISRGRASYRTVMPGGMLKNVANRKTQYFRYKVALASANTFSTFGGKSGPSTTCQTEELRRFGDNGDGFHSKRETNSWTRPREKRSIRQTLRQFETSVSLSLEISDFISFQPSLRVSHPVQRFVFLRRMSALSRTCRCVHVLSGNGTKLSWTNLGNEKQLDSDHFSNLVLLPS